MTGNYLIEKTLKSNNIMMKKEFYLPPAAELWHIPLSEIVSTSSGIDDLEVVDDFNDLFDDVIL